jgi:hypothetical protein
LVIWFIVVITDGVYSAATWCGGNNKKERLKGLIMATKTKKISTPNNVKLLNRLSRMTEEDLDLLAEDNLLRGRKLYFSMSDRFRLTELLKNINYQNNLLAQKCRELEEERDEARRRYCFAMAEHGEESEAKQNAKDEGWDCFNGES